MLLQHNVRRRGALSLASGAASPLLLSEFVWKCFVHTAFQSHTLWAPWSGAHTFTSSSERWPWSFIIWRRYLHFFFFFVVQHPLIFNQLCFSFTIQDVLLDTFTLQHSVVSNLSRAHRPVCAQLRCARGWISQLSAGGKWKDTYHFYDLGVVKKHFCFWIVNGDDLYKSAFPEKSNNNLNL